MATPLGVHVYEASTLSEQAYLQGQPKLTSISFSSEGSMLAAGTVDGSVELWLMSDYSLQQIVGGQGAKAVLASSSDQTIQVWLLSNGIPLKTLRTTGKAGSLTFSPDGRLLAMTLTIGMVEVWGISR